MSNAAARDRALSLLDEANDLLDQAREAAREMVTDDTEEHELARRRIGKRTRQTRTEIRRLGHAFRLASDAGEAALAPNDRSAEVVA